MGLRHERILIDHHPASRGLRFPDQQHRWRPCASFGTGMICWPGPMRRPTLLEAESQCGARRQPCGASWEVHPVTRAGSGPGRQGRGCWSRARTRTVPVSWSVASNLRSGGARFMYISTYHRLPVPMFHVKHRRGRHLRSPSLWVRSEHGLGFAACETQDPRLGVGKARWSPPSVCGTAREASPRTPLRRRGHGWSRSRFTPWL